jgi:predicted nucleic acid-binding protein
MLRYMLDTDICSYVMKRSHDALLRRLQKNPGQRRLCLCGDQV